MNCQNQVAFCRVKCAACDHAGREEQCPMHKRDCGGDNVPSFAQWVAIYDSLSKRRNEQTGMLAHQTTRHILAALGEFKRVMGYTDNDKISVINRKSLTEFCDRVGGRGITRKAKCERIGQAFARWIRYATEDEWQVPRFDQPEIRDDSERFHEPTEALRVAVARWYRSLNGRGNGKFRNRDRIYAMMMYKFAMRNGDVNRLKWSNFKSINGRIRLEYTPHKTRLSSKRIVRVWVDPVSAEDLMEFRRTSGGTDDGYVFGGGTNSTLRDRLNAELREIGIVGSKGLYVLRKLCIHSTYKAHGREAASAISGDDYDTIKTHYADPDAIEVASDNDGL